MEKDKDKVQAEQPKYETAAQKIKREYEEKQNKKSDPTKSIKMNFATRLLLSLLVLYFSYSVIIDGYSSKFIKNPIPVYKKIILKYDAYVYDSSLLNFFKMILSTSDIIFLGLLSIIFIHAINSDRLNATREIAEKHMLNMCQVFIIPCLILILDKIIN